MAGVTARRSMASRQGGGNRTRALLCDHGSMVEFTQWAIDILKRSHEAARRFNPDATVRVFRSDGGVRFVLTDESQPDDQRIERDGFVLLVESGIEGTIDVVEPHDQLILREGR